MLDWENKRYCCGCYACANICPNQCISMQKDEEGFYYPSIDKDKCNNCGLCKKVCSFKNEIADVTFNEPYAAYSKNKEILLTSSSGGIFHHLADYVLKSNGVIYGASFDNDNKVYHIRIDSVDSLDKLKRSKYVQSNLKDVYKQTKSDLKNGQVVLFAGTGCQINSLILYLGVSRVNCENLYTIDIFCHGVPSEKVWEKYLEENNISEKADINFRDKYHGWEKYSVRLNDTKTFFYEDYYMKSFLSECNIRPSCFGCKSKGAKRLSDITIGDYWGVKDTCSEMHKINGTSAVVVHTEKGKKLFNNIKEEIVYKEVSLEDITKHNSAYYKSVTPNKNRNKFFKNLDKYSVDKLCKKYCEKSLFERIIGKMKRIVKRVLNLFKSA